MGGGMKDEKSERRPNQDLQCQLERESIKEARWRQVVQPRSVAAEIQSPQVIQAKPFLLSIQALKHRMRYPSPDASKVSETVITFTSLDSSLSGQSQGSLPYPFSGQTF